MEKTVQNHACMKFCTVFSWGERQSMSKEAAEAAVSTKCVFANGAAELLRTGAIFLLRK